MNLNKYIEHTLLKPEAIKADFIKHFQEAKDCGFFGVCVRQDYVELAKEELKGTDIKVVTVIGFPFGCNITEVKSCETAYAVADGADEIDMVINVSKLKDNDDYYVINDIKEVKNACKDKVLKVILETDLLTKDEIKRACELCVEAGANFVKTSTGYVKGGVGATAENVKLMHDIVASHGLGVKASGGVRDRESALKMIEAGATRIGTSSGEAICKEG